MKVLAYLDFNLQVMMNLPSIQGREESLERNVVIEAAEEAVEIEVALEVMKQLQEEIKEEEDANNNCSLMTHSQHFEEV